MIDYSKPIDDGPTCCGGNDDLRVGMQRHTADCGLSPRALVVRPFAVIREGERPEADEPDDDTVCCTSSGAPSLPDLFVGDGAFDTAMPLVFQRWAAARPAEAFYFRRGASETGEGTLADAVLWVAEGVLP